MTWLPHNFIQSEVSIHATCNNLVCCKTSLNVTWVRKRVTYIFNSFWSNVSKQVTVLPNTPVSLSRVFFSAKNFPQSSQCKNFECNHWFFIFPPSPLLAHATFPFFFLRKCDSLPFGPFSLNGYSKFQQDMYPQNSCSIRKWHYWVELSDKFFNHQLITIF